MKLLTTLLIATLAALAVYSARRRITFALKTGAVVYVVVLFVRIAFDFGSLADRWDDIVWPVFIMLVAWVILWFVSTRYAARREKSRLSASEAARRAR
jgi:ribose/xylose/arabinose/galactoside ABC-type transport system permease subunit